MAEKGYISATITDKGVEIPKREDKWMKWNENRLKC